MSSFFIKGGNGGLFGDVVISGSKNASMPIIISSLMSSGDVLLDNIPFTKDIGAVLGIMNILGCKISFSRLVEGEIEKKVVKINTPNNISLNLTNINQACEIRTSILFLAPLLARFGKVKLPMPGGCTIGERKIDLHLMAIKKMGAKVIEGADFIEATLDGKRFQGAVIDFPIISVGATQNALCAAVFADGVTVLNNVAIEPEIDALVLFLNKLGAKIEKSAERQFTIDGVKSLSGHSYKIPSDRIEAATYAIFAALTDGKIVLKNVSIKEFENILATFNQVGIDISSKPDGFGGDIITCSRAKTGLKAVNIDTAPFPGFPTDLQPQMMVLLCLANGERSVIKENIFENRLRHVSYLKQIGANIQIEGNTATITGVKKFANNTGVPIKMIGTDLRASAALVMASVVCEGSEVIVENISQLDRGYESFESRINKCGAKVKRVL